MFKKFFLIASALFIIGGLSGVVAHAADRSIPPKTLRHNYTTVLKDSMGHTLLTIEYRYIGKFPQGKYPTKPHNWKKIDTDFYQRIITNHTRYVVEFLTMETWPERMTSGVNIKTDNGEKNTVSVLPLI